jgi:UMF1 family MFS transporter
MEAPYNKKTQQAWAFYDWANSVYSLVISTAIFPIYYAAVTSINSEHTLTFLGFEFVNTALYSYTFSFSFLVVCVLTPLLSGVADYSGNKKMFLQLFCYLGAVSCGLLYFFSVEHLGFGLLCMVGASVGFWGSQVFYNAYLPEIAPPEEHDALSAKGFALGYLGSALLLIVNLLFITFPHWIIDINQAAAALLLEQVELSNQEALEQATSAAKLQVTRYSFLSVALWWVLFAQITFARLPKDIYHRKPKGNVFSKGFLELQKVWRELKHSRMLTTFLWSFFIYSMGVQTVILMATLFAEEEINMDTTALIGTILIIQFVAIAGSYLFSFLSSKLGNLNALKISLILWFAACGSAYFVTEASAFYLLAATVGLVLGGIQALSRSTYSKMLPKTIDHASYFSFYDVCEKLGIVIGTFSYGLIIDLTGNMRNSIFALGLFFLLGIILLYRIPRKNLPKSLLGSRA